MRRGLYHGTAAQSLHDEALPKGKTLPEAQVSGRGSKEEMLRKVLSDEAPEC